MSHELNSFRDGQTVLLSIAIDTLDCLISDLWIMRGSIEHDGKVPAWLAGTAKRNVLRLLDSILPQIEYAIAEFELYSADPKIGAPR